MQLPLLGRHQVENAATAVLAVENCSTLDITDNPASVSKALSQVRWPGRLEIVKRRPLVVLDGAHNADSAKRLAQALRSTFSPRRTLLIVGLNADKDIAGFAGALMDGLPSLDVVATRAAIRRAAEPTAVAQAFVDLGASARIAQSVGGALDDVLAEADPADLICVTGSLYVVVEARAWLLGIMPDGVEPAPAASGEKST